MKILWITNILFPDVCKIKNLPIPVIGGWMYSLANALLIESDIELAVATVFNGDRLEKHVLNHVTYYLLPLKGDIRVYQKSLEPYWQYVDSDFHPDVVHLHGTEFPHGLAFLRTAQRHDNVVASIQGLVSVYDRYYLGGMKFKDIFFNITFRDVLRHNNLWQAQKDFTRRGKYERELLSNIGHVIGRTIWDKVHVLAINENINYHFCDETLRKVFYNYTWNYDKCEKYSIFLSQASYPIKGLHQVLKALPHILQYYPNAKIYVGGSDITKVDTLINRLRLSGYGNYLRKLIKKLHIEKHVIFLGLLNEQQICEQYLKSNVFICPSSVENSPNSLGEAQLLGVPCIASYVGGVPGMMEGYDRGMMYRFEEIEMLAQLVVKVFGKNYSTVLQFNPAKIRHASNKNVLKLLEIYNEIAD